MGKWIKRILIGLGVFVTIAGGAISILMFEEASTPDFVDENGRRPKNSIAEMRWVNIGGIDQFLLVRTRDKSNPPMIVIHGGPGSPEGEVFRAYNSALEDHFSVVHWHQRGAGWTFTGSERAEDLAVDKFVSDLGELVDYTFNEFGEQKIFLLGHSWGSFLGIRYVRDHPEKIAAYIGVGQVTDMVESEQRGCDYILEQAQAANDLDDIEEISSFCRPPFTKDYVLKQRAYLTKYGGDMLGDLTMLGMVQEAWTQPEVTLPFLVRLMRGSLRSLDFMWDDLMTVNFFDEPKSFEAPIHFVLGRGDYQVSATLAAEYFEQIDAPCKSLKWFEASGHNPMFEEPQAFNDYLINEIRPGVCEAAKE
jgi:pimeloyl-ACP methyl ester carboxylesterase